MNGSPKPWSGCRALLPNVTCHSSPADVSVSHESSISHWTWIIDRKEIHHGMSEAHLSALGARMVPFASLVPSPKISLQPPPFLTMSLPKPKPPSHLYHPCTLSSRMSLILSCFASYTSFPSSPQTHQAPFKLGSLPCLEHSMPLLQLVNPTRASDPYSNVTFPEFSLTPPNLKEIPDPPFAPWIIITISKYLLICVFVCLSVPVTVRLWTVFTTLFSGPRNAASNIVGTQYCSVNWIFGWLMGLWKGNTAKTL